MCSMWLYMQQVVILFSFIIEKTLSWVDQDEKFVQLR